MSRIGKQPIKIPESVKVSIENDFIVVSGPKGTLKQKLVSGVSIHQEEGVLKVSRDSDIKRNVAMHGLYRALIANMVCGVVEGFLKKMQVVGVGYRVQAKGNRLNLTIGKSHPVFFDVPEKLSLKVVDATHFEISGIDKQLVGQVAADIRSLYPPEPYKLKGIRYEDEKIRRKEGKSST